MTVMVSLFRKRVPEGYEAKSRVTVPTARTCHLDDYTSADTGWLFLIGVTTTVSECSDSTIT